MWARPVLKQHGSTRPLRHKVPPVVGPMHRMRNHINSHTIIGTCRVYHLVTVRAHNVSQHPGVLGVNGAVFAQFNRYDFSRKGLRVKASGNVGI